MQFKVINRAGLNIRSKPSTDNNGQIIGHFAEGEVFEAEDIFSNQAGQTWARLTKASGPRQEYVCLQIRNRVFAEPTAIQPTPEPISLLAWAIQIDHWARLNGFKGPKPNGLP